MNAKERVSQRVGQLVILSNGIRVFVEHLPHEWRVTELLTGLGIPVKEEQRKTLRVCLSALDGMQDTIYNAVKRVFSGDMKSFETLFAIRGWVDSDINDICYYARNGTDEEFLSEYKCLCGYALEWAKEQERYRKGDAE